ncbi:MAG: hypothetical protein R2794_04410 [Chitinophagales bacterium]
MKYYGLVIGLLLGLSLQAQKPADKGSTDPKNDFVWQADQFADLGVLRYQIPGWDKLTLQQKELVYYLTQAGYCGRDIIWDQNYRYNLAIRNMLEEVIQKYNGDKNSKEWLAFVDYTKRVWFSNGIHHHYSMDKFFPGFPQDWLVNQMKALGISFDAAALNAMFDTQRDLKKVNLAAGEDLLLTSATNFYGPDITQAEAEAYYKNVIDTTDPHAISYGLNSTLIRKDGKLIEDVWKSGGRYGAAIDQIIYWLDKAAEVAENPQQADALRILIKYYLTGDLKVWDDYNIAWTEATEGDIDYINSFIEVYNDPLGYRGSFESIVEIKDFDASARMATLSEHAQWFEDNSPIMDEHKKNDVVGVSYKVVNVAGESGDASPSTPIGVNLPNANWIRADFGSKSVSLGNIVAAYDQAGGGVILNEFCYSKEEKERAEKYGSLAAKMHTAMHEVIGHASGKINKGVGTPKETLKNYANTLEEARADLVGLYYIMDPKLVEWGLIPSLEVGKAEYDSYIRNGLMIQLRRIEDGKNLEEAHMRNRQLIASWVYEHGKANNVIVKKLENGKTYFVIQDYDALRALFGELLREIQRIKSEGDYDAAMALVETYGVQVDESIHLEVLKRTSGMHIAPYFGFINPDLTPVTDNEGNITDILVSYPADFMEQMLEYSEKYGYLARQVK